MNLDPKISLSKYSVTPKLLRSGITEHLPFPEFAWVKGGASAVKGGAVKLS